MQSMYSDGSYNKPFFVVYANSSIFAIATIPRMLRFTIKHGIGGVRDTVIQTWREQRYQRLNSGGEGGAGYSTAFQSQDRRRLLSEESLLSLADDNDDDDGDNGNNTTDSIRHGSHREPTYLSMPKPLLDDSGRPLTFGETAYIGFEFSMLWFLANYLGSACLEYTGVASATILTSTSSVWTLVFGARSGVESFTARKLMGVAASMCGIVLVSTVDLTGHAGENRGSFPEKSTAETAVGDAMALASAVVYGVYMTVMKLRVGNEQRVDVFLFLGFVGWFNLLMLWPGFVILHLTGVEKVGLAIWLNVSRESFVCVCVCVCVWVCMCLLTVGLVRDAAKWADMDDYRCE